MKNKKFWISVVAGILVAALVLSLIIAALPVHAEQSSSEIRDQINQMQADNAAIEEEIKKLKEQQKDNATDIQDLVIQKSVIEQQVGLLHAQIKNLNEQIAAFSVLIADKQEEMGKAEQKLEALNVSVYTTQGDYNNIKITTPEDIAVGEQILSRLS